MDKDIEELGGHLEKRFIETGQPCRLDEWLKHCEPRMRLWNAPDLRFGAGSRICIGRHLSETKMYKVITLITRYNIELVDATEKWKPVARWLYRIDRGGYVQAEKA
ncbi:uncharacterized protein PG998_001664 [Apiospora kogelbergensis]|uniref:Cytochrome P450 n=1 Tax=Apiospora kogelbergensis TaxID=1337665 RepID=A0AAW0QQR4_9PEZI